MFSLAGLEYVDIDMYLVMCVSATAYVSSDQGKSSCPSLGEAATPGRAFACIRLHTKYLRAHALPLDSQSVLLAGPDYVRAALHSPTTVGPRSWPALTKRSCALPLGRRTALLASPDGVRR